MAVNSNKVNNNY